MSKETNDVDIRKLYEQMKDELRNVVYIAVVIGGAFGAGAGLAITDLNATSRLVLIFLGSVFGFHLGKLRKQDLYEKSLLLYYFMDLLPKTTTEEPKKDVVEETETPTPVEVTPTTVTETKAVEEIKPEVAPVVAAEETKTELAPASPTPEPIKPEVKTVVKKARGKPVKLSSN